MASRLLSEVSFAALLVYSPRGQSEVSRVSRAGVRDALKRGDESLIQRATQHVAGNEVLREFIGDAVLVPCPRSAPLVSERALWPGSLVATALVGAGVGVSVEPWLMRLRPVPKSAFQGAGGRPDAETHFETMTVVAPRLHDAPRRIVVVDDFVTKGNTLLGATSRVKEAFPGADVKAFALVRTLGLQPEIERVLDPCVGVIRLVRNEADRSP